MVGSWSAGVPQPALSPKASSRAQRRGCCAFAVGSASAPPQQDDHDHEHHDPKGNQDPPPPRTPPPEREVAGVVCTVALMFADAERVIDTFDGGLAADWLLVTVLAPPEPVAGEL